MRLNYQEFVWVGNFNVVCNECKHTPNPYVLLWNFVLCRIHEVIVLPIQKLFASSKEPPKTRNFMSVRKSQTHPRTLLHTRSSWEFFGNSHAAHATPVLNRFLHELQSNCSFQIFQRNNKISSDLFTVDFFFTLASSRISCWRWTFHVCYYCFFFVIEIANTALIHQHIEQQFPFSDVHCPSCSCVNRIPTPKASEISVFRKHGASVTCSSCRVSFLVSPALPNQGVFKWCEQNNWRVSHDRSDGHAGSTQAHKRPEKIVINTIR